MQLNVAATLCRVLGHATAAEASGLPSETAHVAMFHVSGVPHLAWTRTFPSLHTRAVNLLPLSPKHLSQRHPDSNLPAQQRRTAWDDPPARGWRDPPT